MTATGTAPGKLILAGEHSVVYGRPAVAMPFHAVRAEAVATWRDGPVAIETDRPGMDLAGLIGAARATLAFAGRAEEGVGLAIRSTIPPGAGLGSSGATATAVVRAVAAACGLALDRATLLRLIDVAELYTHGKSSQLDANTIVADGPIRFVRGGEPEPLKPAFKPRLLVANSGEPRNTRDAVVAFAAGLGDKPDARLDILGNAANEAAQALVHGEPEALGAAMNTAHAMLLAIGVSTPRLDWLAAVARAHGALGAKLTGAGRGGCIVALGAEDTDMAAMAAALRAEGAAVYGEDLA